MVWLLGGKKTPATWLTFTHKSGWVEQEPGICDVLKALPTSPDDGNSWLTIVAAGKKAAQFGDGEDGVFDRR